MRVLRTDFVYDGAGRPDHEDRHEHVAVAWIATGNTSPAIKGLLSTYLEIRDYEEDELNILLFLWSCLHETTEDYFGYLEMQSKMAGDPGVYGDVDEASKLLTELVIIERSPPETVTLGSILRSGSPILIGAYIGAKAAPEEIFMFVSVPAGILIVSSAVGLARGIEQGLYKSISKLIEKAIK